MTEISAVDPTGGYPAVVSDVVSDGAPDVVPLIAVNDLRKRYGYRPILRGVDLTIKSGEVVALLGSNGAGKSTLMRSIAGLSKPDRGEVHLGGAGLQSAGHELRRYVGLVSHAPLLYESLNGLENLRFFASMYDMQDPDERIEALLREVDLWPRRHDLVRTYSRGMIQRLAIARAILHDPPVLLLDEPDTGLDEPSAQMLHELIQHLRASDRAILFTTHHFGRALAWSDRVCLLREGTIEVERSSNELTLPELRRLYVAKEPSELDMVGNEETAFVADEMGISSPDFADPADKQPNHEQPDYVQHDYANEALVAAPVQMATEGGFGAFWRKAWSVARKDVRTELRTKEVLGTMAVFGILAVLIFGLAFDLRVPQAKMVVPGVVWVVLLFTGVMGLNRSFGSEVEQGSMMALLMAPVQRGAIFCGKVMSGWLFILVTLLLVLPVVLVIFDTNLFQLWILLALLLGSFGYVVVGTLFAALTANSRARETLLPILLLPVLVPLFVAGLSLTGNVLDGRTFSNFGSWFAILAVYGLFFGLLSFAVFDLIWEDN